MAARVRVTDRDKGYRALMRRVQKAARGRTVKVGLLSGNGGAPSGDGDKSLLDVATFHEFGIGNNPERSFVRAWFDENKNEHKALERKLAESVVRGQNTVDSALDKMGLLLSATMQMRIRGGIGEDLAESTIERKGSSTQLVDTGSLVSAISHEVE